MVIPCCSRTRILHHSKVKSPISWHTRKASPRWPQSIAYSRVGRSGKVLSSGSRTHLSLRSALGLIRPQPLVSFAEDAPRCISSSLVICAGPCPSRGILCVPQGAKRDISFGVYGVYPSELFSELRRSDVGHDEGGMSGVW